MREFYFGIDSQDTAEICHPDYLPENPEYQDLYQE
jgi:hypothetical protein